MKMTMWKAIIMKIMIIMICNNENDNERIMCNIIMKIMKENESNNNINNENNEIIMKMKIEK